MKLVEMDMIDTYGEEVLDELREKKNQHLRLRDHDYLEMIELYKEKIKQLHFC